MRNDTSLVEKIKQIVESKTSFRVSMHYLMIKVYNSRVSIYLLPAFNYLELVRFVIKLSDNSFIEYQYDSHHHSWRLIANGDLVAGRLWYGDSLKLSDTQLLDMILDIETGGIPAPLVSFILPVLNV